MEFQDLVAAIKAAGGAVATLKKSGTKSGPEFDNALAALLEAKAAYKAEAGSDYGPPSKKKKKKKGGGGGGGQPQGPTKKELRMKKKAEAEKKRAAEAAAAASAGGSAWGDLPIILSTEQTDKKWTRISSLSAMAGSGTVLVRARLHKARVKGKRAFLVIRQGIHTVQVIFSQSDDVPKTMLKYIGGLTTESIIDVEGTVADCSENPVTGTSVSTVELQGVKVFCVNRSEGGLPFVLEDTTRSTQQIADAKAEGKQMATVALDLRLDYRWIDLRSRTNQAIFRVQTVVCALFRSFLLAQSPPFVEMHSPKLIGGTSEGGAEVFRLDYFGQEVCLAQSPQLYKQMVTACSGFERCFEIGPVFRAEKHNTTRHLCEFTGMDMEMCFNEHYHEVLDVFGRLFVHIFEGVHEQCAAEIECVREQYPSRPLEWNNPALLLSFQEGMALLGEAGFIEIDGPRAGLGADPTADLSHAAEHRLGQIVYEKYGTDFFMMDKYPMEARPFYTMPAAENNHLSNSYDFFIRGQEITSGAQRIHDPELLTEVSNIEREEERERGRGRERRRGEREHPPPPAARARLSSLTPRPSTSFYLSLSARVSRAYRQRRFNRTSIPSSMARSRMREAASASSASSASSSTSRTSDASRCSHVIRAASPRRAAACRRVCTNSTARRGLARPNFFILTTSRSVSLRM